MRCPAPNQLTLYCTNKLDFGAEFHNCQKRQIGLDGRYLI
jgi:hypothetical protein